MGAEKGGRGQPLSLTAARQPGHTLAPTPLAQSTKAFSRRPWLGKRTHKGSRNHSDTNRETQACLPQVGRQIRRSETHSLLGVRSCHGETQAGKQPHRTFFPFFLPSLPSLCFLLMVLRKLLADGKFENFLRSESLRPRHLDRRTCAGLKARVVGPQDSSVADLWASLPVSIKPDADWLFLPPRPPLLPPLLSHFKKSHHVAQASLELPV